MKLLLRTSFYYIIITFIVFSIGSVILYNIFLNEITKETDLYLVERFHTIINTLDSANSPSVIGRYKLQLDTLNYVPDKVGRESFVFSDTMVMHQYLRRLENNRKMTGVVMVNESYMRLTLYDVIVEGDDIMDGVFNGLWRLFLFLGSVMVVSSFLISRSIFKPFNRTLQQIRGFNIKELRPIRLERSHTNEFNLMNEFIEQMTEKINQDYRNLKEFSENASHEMQTPLSIAKGKLELLLQSNDLDEKKMNMIESAYKSIDHISKLGSSLTLLSRIENLEFSERQSCTFSDMLRKALEDFEELYKMKKIQVEVDLAEHVVVQNNPDLLKILINNLLNNALRHNCTGGRIRINLDQSRFTITNTGEPLQIAPELLFERFKKDRQSGSSLGLGLAIVKKICDVSGYDIGYDFKNGWHTVDVKFKN
ncbi:MAG: HAMP domain-containing histidine kinase [Cyclobacteriaceae bacterium]|nr:HAMP domain-containing histidine kinase [Cyclobacteriaceae bacterium]